MTAGRVVGLAHVAVAVRDVRERIAFWAEALGLESAGVEVVAAEGVRTWFLELGRGASVELLEPLPGAEGPVARFLAGRGEGIHHVCLAVDDLGAALARLAARGIAPAGTGVRTGAGGRRVAFLHPRDTGGVLVELAEAAEAPDDGGADPVGRIVVIYLTDPRERVVGLLRRLDSGGAIADGLDHNSWEDWLAQWVRGEEGPLAPSLQFFPARRIEKILVDRDQPELPSLARQFRERTGRSLAEVLANEGGRGR